MGASVRQPQQARLVPKCIPRDAPEQGSSAPELLIRPVPVSTSPAVATNSVCATKNGTKIAARAAPRPSSKVILPAPRPHGARPLPPAHLLTAAPEGPKVASPAIPVVKETPEPVPARVELSRRFLHQ